MEQTGNRCTFCGFNNKLTAKACALCKKPIVTRMEAARKEIINSLGTRQKVCVACGKAHDAGSVFCSHCQSELVYASPEKTGGKTPAAMAAPSSAASRTKGGRQAKALSVFSNVASLTAGIFVGLTLARFL